VPEPTIIPTDGRLRLHVADGEAVWEFDAAVLAVEQIAQNKRRTVVLVTGPAGHLHLRDRAKHRFTLEMGDAPKEERPSAEDRRAARERVKEALAAIEAQEAVADIPTLKGILTSAKSAVEAAPEPSEEAVARG
jgi:hypothetical protein